MPPPSSTSSSSWRRPFAGALAELRARLPLYADDWLVGLRDKRALSATVYIFAANALPAITFAMLLAERTGGLLGVVEAIFAMALGGLAYALFAGQPLVIVGVTGPVAILCATVVEMAWRLGLPPLGWLSWTCVWSSVMHLVLSAVGAPRLFPRFATAFAEDCFGTLIGVIYCYEGASSLVRPFVDAAHATPGSPSSLESALLALLLGLGTALVAGKLSGARGWPVLPRGLRGLIADYGPTAVILAVAALPQLPLLRDVTLARLQVPASFAPSSAAREGWWTGPEMAATPGWGIAAALVPALVLTALLYFDATVTSLLSQRPEYGLKKPPCYDLDFALLGLVVLACGLLGLPPPYALIPQAPLHVRSLAKIREEGDGPLKREVWVRVCETRVSALGQSLLLLVLLTKPLLGALSAVPKGVLAGQFLFLGLSGLAGNALVKRLTFSLMDAAGRAAVRGEAWAALPLRVVAAFTGVQLAVVAAIVALTLSPGALAFPLAILALIPVRLMALPRLFTAEQLAVLDPRRAESGGGGGGGGGEAEEDGTASKGAAGDVGTTPRPAEPGEEEAGIASAAEVELLGRERRGGGVG
jgi:boron transporter